MDADYSDTELDPKQHKRLLDNVLNLDARQYVNKPTRTEPTAQISEYNLIKSLTDNNDAVKLYDLTKSLKNRAVDVELRKKVKKAEVKSKTLAKPLEKPQAERIKRSVAYENTKKHLDRWDPLVSSNRVSTNLTFPLKDHNFDYKEAKDFTSNWVLKSDLQKALDKLEPKVETYEVETDTKTSMTLKQMIEKRREMAKNRRYQSSKEIKARWQNKIKSKKYRRIHRKEKIKEQMKEFELLQKTNPEEAMQKLEEIEKARAEERASLRHKSTGKWARNQQVRAKYDKESRKVLAEQLSISKDLMQKQQLSESSNSEDDDINENGNNVVSGIKVSKEIEDFVNAYQKFSENHNMQNAANNSNLEGGNKNDTKPILKDTENTTTTEGDGKSKKRRGSENTVDVNKQSANVNNVKKRRVHEENIKEFDGAKQLWDVELIEENLIINDNIEHKVNKKYNKINAKFENKLEVMKRDKKVEKGKNKKGKKANETEQSVVTENTKRSAKEELPESIDNIFDNIEHKLKIKVNEKYNKIKAKLENEPEMTKRNIKLVKGKNKKGNEANKTEEAVVTDDTKYNTNEELPGIETCSEQNMTAEIKLLKNIIAAEPPKIKETKNIDVNTLKNTNHKLESGIPDLLSYDDNEETSDQRGVAMDAFEDDSLAEEFAKDKNDVIEKDTPKDIDLSIPGWGSWGGQNIAISKRKKKRFLLKFPKEMPRKDMNKGDLIINESANDKIKPHLVNELPFPFKTVKDFEASVRAPIGNTFVPETAFRKMIQPTIRTRMGAIIEPVTEDVLLHKEEKKYFKRK